MTPIPSVCREHHRWPSVMSVSYGEDGITASIQKSHDALMTRSTHRANARTVNDPDAHAAHGTAPRHRGEVQGARRRVDRQSRRIAHRLVVRVHRRRHVRVAEMPLVYNDARTSIHNMKSRLGGEMRARARMRARAPKRRGGQTSNPGGVTAAVREESTHAPATT